MTRLTQITFFERFEADILARRKTITLRDKAESYVEAGQVLPVSTLEGQRWFCDIEVLKVTPVAYSALTEQHAAQENMSLDELKRVIDEIYPGLEALYEIQFKLVNSSFPKLAKIVKKRAK